MLRMALKLSRIEATRKCTLQQTQHVYRESVAGSVIKVTGTVEFEDGLWIGNHPKARNILQRVCTIPGVQPGVVAHPGSSEGRLNSNLSGSTWLLGVEPGAGLDSQKLQC